MPKRQSTTTSGSRKARSKPKKPTKAYPLTPHPNGQWCKKVKGKVYFFGVWEDPDAALDAWLEDKDHLNAGKDRPSKSNGATVAEVTDAYYESQVAKVESGELGRNTLDYNKRTCKRITDTLGLDTPVESLAPSDFSKFRSRLGKTLSARSLGIELQRIRSVFNYGLEEGLIERLPKYGTAFKKPPEKLIRRERNQRGSQMFEADEIRLLLESAGTPLKAMILLGVNCGFGQADVATLNKSAVDLKAGVIDFPRAKTEIRRRATLWPETIAALREASRKRPKPKRRDDRDLWFITTHGEAYARCNANGVWLDAVRQMFNRRLKDLKLEVPGRGFYGLRRSFLTLADEVKDIAAVDYIMGHTADRGDMRQHYRQRISDDRLRAVTDHVRAWLWPEVE